MTGRQWRTAALVLWFHYVIMIQAPWLIDHWGMTWGVIAATVGAVPSTLVALIPLREKRTPKDPTDAQSE